MIGGFTQGILGRDWREDVKGERARCCQETQPESHSMASWAETGTSALLTVTESTLSPIILSLCDTTEWGAELRKALGEPFLSTIQVSCAEDLSRNSFSSQQKPSQGSRWASHLIQNLLQTSHEALGSVPSDYTCFCMPIQVALGSSTLYQETSATFPRKWPHLFSQSLNQATLKVWMSSTNLCPPFSQHEGKWVLLPLENLHFFIYFYPKLLEDSCSHVDHHQSKHIQKKKKTTGNYLEAITQKPRNSKLGAVSYSFCIVFPSVVCITQG